MAIVFCLYAFFFVFLQSFRAVIADMAKTVVRLFT